MRLETGNANVERIGHCRARSGADGAIIAEVPELPGCAADGATHQEALEKVEIVIREWIETANELGRPIPAPRGRLMYA
jgi:predicted RNase H-like HicB family nuclease